MQAVKTISILLLIVLSIVLIYVLYRHFTTKFRIKRAFIEGNVVVTGRKRFGKDVLMNAVIKWRNEPYFANINYGYKYHHIDLKELELTPNDYKNFISGNVVKCEKNKKLEGHDVYISDAGIYLPSQYDSMLHKQYPSLPITYALSGHIYANGIHCNAQRMERIWKALREQADYYIHIRKRCLKLPFFIVVFTTEYTKYESAKQELSPLGSRFLNKYSKAETDKFKATNGFIKNGFVIIPKAFLKYDSRAFHEVIFGELAPKKEVKSLWKNLLQNWKKISKRLRKKSNTTKSTKAN